MVGSGPRTNVLKAKCKMVRGALPTEFEFFGDLRQNYMRGLFILFLTVPMLEMWLLIEVGQVIGAWQTIGLVALTAIIGVSMLKRQGLKTLMRVQDRLNNGQLPAEELLEGIFLAVGGALLLTPGFVTDAIGFCCLLPFTRRWLARKLIKSGQFAAMQAGSGGMASGFQYQHYEEHSVGGGSIFDNDPRVIKDKGGKGEQVIEGEYRRED